MGLICVKSSDQTGPGSAHAWRMFHFPLLVRDPAQASVRSDRDGSPQLSDVKFGVSNSQNSPLYLVFPVQNNLSPVYSRANSDRQVQWICQNGVQHPFQPLVVCLVIYCRAWKAKKTTFSRLPCSSIVIQECPINQMYLYEIWRIVSLQWLEMGSYCLIGTVSVL